MAVRDMVPFGGRRRQARNRGLARRQEQHPLTRMHEELDRLFDDFFSEGFGGLERFGRGWEEYLPEVDVQETDKEVQVSAELPGVEEKDIDVRIDGDNLIISGEKSEEKEDTEGDVYHSERYYGTFSRAIPLNSEVDIENADATFKKGVLKLRLPKTGTEKSAGRKIEVKGE